MIQKSMSLEYEPSSESLLISAKQLIWGSGSSFQDSGFGIQGVASTVENCFRVQGSGCGGWGSGCRV